MRDLPARLGAGIRRAAGSVIVDGFFRGMARLGRLHPDARPERHNVELVRDVPYIDDGATDHLLDIYRPRGAHGPLPVVLYVHGGSFRILSKDSHWVMGLAFARKGYLVLNINYRLAPRHPYPAPLEDAAAALRWAMSSAACHGGDPSRLVLAGESAGANLVTALAVCCCYERSEPFARQVWESGAQPRAVIPACGMLQVSDPGRFARRRRLAAWVADRMDVASEAYLGPPRASAALELADPLVVLERAAPPNRPLPPFLVQVGTRDPLLDDTRRLAAALARLRVPCEAYYYPGEIHAFHALAWRKQARRAWGHIYAFLDRHVPPASEI